MIKYVLILFINFGHPDIPSDQWSISVTKIDKQFQSEKDCHQFAREIREANNMLSKVTEAHICQPVEFEAP
jgi:hypothetical protein